MVLEVAVTLLVAIAGYSHIYQTVSARHSTPDVEPVAPRPIKRTP